MQPVFVRGYAGAGKKWRDPFDLKLGPRSMVSEELPLLVTLTFCTEYKPTRTEPKIGGLVAVSADTAADAGGAEITAGITPARASAAKAATRRDHPRTARCPPSGAPCSVSPVLFILGAFDPLRAGQTHQE
jgi:hypothetical protein